MIEPIPDLTEEEIIHRLEQVSIESTGVPYAESPYLSQMLPDPPRPAAVLIPLLRQDGAWFILYTRRTATLAEHSGQVAFPGGRADEGDPDPETTALREAYEEIGMQPARVRVLGRLDDFVTVTNYRVTPVVGVIPWPYILHLELEEVSRAFTIPINWLANPANYEIRLRTLPAPYAPVRVIYFQPYDGEVLWGASARFTLALLKILWPERKQLI